jgi:hypothetical protein
MTDYLSGACLGNNHDQNSATSAEGKNKKNLSGLPGFNGKIVLKSYLRRQRRDTQYNMDLIRMRTKNGSYQ